MAEVADVSADVSETTAAPMPERERAPYVKRERPASPRSGPRDGAPRKPFDDARPPRRFGAETQDVVPGERIAKRLARAGVASRRDAEA